MEIKKKVYIGIIIGIFVLAIGTYFVFSENEIVSKLKPDFLKGLTSAQMTINEYVELLIKTSDNVLSKLPREEWTQEMLEEERRGNAKQGYIIAVKDSPAEWGNLETDPKRFAIVKIPKSEFNESWLEPEYDYDNPTCYKVEIGEEIDCIEAEKLEIEVNYEYPIKTQRKYRLPLESFMNETELNDLKNIEYNSKVDWSIEKNLNITDLIVNNNYDELHINATDVEEFKKQSLVKNIEDFTNKEELILHGSSGVFEICVTNASGQCNYSSLATWEAGEDGAITATGPCIANITEGFYDNTAVTIDGFTTNASSYVQIITDVASGARHNGKWSDTAYILNISSGNPLTISDNYVIVDGMQINSHGTGAGTNGIDITIWGTHDVTIKNCIINMNRADSNYGAGIKSGVGFGSALNSSFIWNTIVMNSPRGIQCPSDTDVSMYVYNSLVYNSTSANADCYYFRGGTANYIYNSIAVNCLQDVDNTTAITVENMASNSGFGVNPQILDSTNNYENEFVDYLGEDFHLVSTSVAIDNADSSLVEGRFSDDIDGDTRTGTWDIGADEANVFPQINFTNPTPANASSQSNTDIYVNYSVSDSDGDDIYSFINFDNSLVGWWRMDNDSSIGENDTHVYDWSGNGNNGTVTDAVPNSSGKFSGAFEFDGVDDYIIIGTGSDYSDLCVDGCSFSAWVYFLSQNANKVIVGRNDGGDNNRFFSFYILTNGRIDLSIWTDGTPANGNCLGAGTSSSLSTNTWYHFAGVFNFTHIAMYVNGKLDTGPDACAEGFSINETAWQDSETTYIGIEDDSGLFFDMNGSIDEVAIFNRSLSAEEVQALYNATKTYHNFTDQAVGTHTFQAFAVDQYGNKNQTEERTVEITGGVADTEYPVFSNYWDNNATLTDSGTGLFNVTLLSTNGTVLLEIDGNNITATNLTADVYNASHTFTSSGNYAYRWHSWGNGTSANYNVSDERSYSVNSSAQCNPVLDEDWDISDEQICDAKEVTTGTGVINILTGGILRLINYSNVTTSELKLQTTGDQVFICTGCELRIT